MYIQYIHKIYILPSIPFGRAYHLPVLLRPPTALPLSGSSGGGSCTSAWASVSTHPHPTRASSFSRLVVSVNALAWDGLPARLFFPLHSSQPPDSFHFRRVFSFLGLPLAKQHPGKPLFGLLSYHNNNNSNNYNYKNKNNNNKND